MDRAPTTIGMAVPPVTLPQDFVGVYKRRHSSPWTPPPAAKKSRPTLSRIKWMMPKYLEMIKDTKGMHSSPYGLATTPEDPAEGPPADAVANPPPLPDYDL